MKAKCILVDEYDYQDVIDTLPGAINPSLPDQMKLDFLAENLDKITLEQLESLIK